jgi:large subunit ribosomal protein L4
MVEILRALGLAGHKVLIVIEGADPFVERSARNLPGVAVLRAAGLNVFDVLRHDRLVMTVAALEAVERRLGAAPAEGAA